MKLKYYFYSKSYRPHFFQYVKDIYPNIRFTKKIQINKKNFVLENFNDDDVKNIINIKKKYPKTTILLICSEFINSRLRTFNYFGKNFFVRIFLFFLLRVFDLLIFLKKKFSLNRVLKKKLYKRKKNTNTFYLKLIEILYFKKRFDNFLKIVNYSDLIIFTHPETLDNFKFNKKIKKIFFPYQIRIGNKNKTSTFNFSGSVTKYRLNFFKKLNFLSIGNKNLKELELLYNKCLANLNDKNYSYNQLKFSFFSLNPRKDFVWPHSSPGRYIDSIRYGEIPLVFDNFNDNFSKNISLKVSFHSTNSIIKIIKNKKEIKRKFLKKIKKIRSEQVKKKEVFKKIISKF